MPPDGDPNESDRLLSTHDLLLRARAGNEVAAAELLSRFAPPLRRLLHARLPGHVRGPHDTDDLVQEVCARALVHLDGFEYRGQGSFWSYLRRIGLNHVTEVTRRQGPRMPTLSMDESAREQAASGTGPLGQLLKEERFRAFEEALECLSDVQRQAVLMRMELRLPYETIALECGFVSAAAARMAICRAIGKVIERMSRQGHGEG